MKCDKCGRCAVAELRYMNAKFCKNCFSGLLERRVRRTILNNKMLDRKRDIVGVGVSGGKDSTVLLYLLNKMHYNIRAIAVDEGIRGYRDRSLEYAVAFCEEHDIPFYICSFEEEYGVTMDELAKQGAPCSYCGVLRRKLINKVAREVGCSRFVTGHNLDDETQSMLMNFMRSELQRMARGGGVVGLVQDKEFVTRVKPLRECPEREIAIYAIANGIDYHGEDCPYFQQGMRNHIRRAINDIEEHHPGTKFACLRSYDNMLPFLKKYFANAGAPNKCKECGELASGTICKACQMSRDFRK
jgi:uncharacterized protein (TIGR00269 family)